MTGPSVPPSKLIVWLEAGISAGCPELLSDGAHAIIPAPVIKTNNMAGIKLFISPPKTK
jgi:hypothetical protein